MSIVNDNVKTLTNLTKYFKSDIRAKLNELINLYKERKKYKTVQKLITDNLIEKKEFKINRAYDKIKNKYQDVEPARNRRRVKRTVIKQDVGIQAILYTNPKEDAFEDKKKHKRGYKHKGLHQVYHGSIKLTNFELKDKSIKILENIIKNF